MGNRIIITPSGYGTASDKISVGKNFTNNLSGFNGKIFVIDLDNLPRPEPTIDLPPYTIRLRYRDGVTPSFAHGTATQVSQSPNVWDLTYESGSWRNLLKEDVDLLEVLGANSTGVWRMDGMFNWCENLTSVAAQEEMGRVRVSDIKKKIDSESARVILENAIAMINRA